MSFLKRKPHRLGRNCLFGVWGGGGDMFGSGQLQSVWYLQFLKKQWETMRLVQDFGSRRSGTPASIGSACCLFAKKCFFSPFILIIFGGFFVIKCELILIILWYFTIWQKIWIVWYSPYIYTSLSIIMNRWIGAAQSDFQLSDTIIYLNRDIYIFAGWNLELVLYATQPLPRMWLYFK